MDERKKRLIKILGLLLSLWAFVIGIGHVWGWRVSRITEVRAHEAKSEALTPPRSGDSQMIRRMQGLPPKGLYISIDTASNILYLKEGNRTLLAATISAGSGSILKDPANDRNWIFETPRGEFTIISKFTKPSWIKPDWAFIEEGKSIPKNFSERVEEGVLGDYALGFGNGYFIHGTLYTRLLGKNITHGCIRVGDQDLKTIYRTVSLGTKVYIF
jgi:lipoprotein-anchoring transpeptidase ErfK/SrfK